MNVLVTGAGGLIGYETSKFFLRKRAEIVGIDNNMRRYFFGEKGDTNGNITCLQDMSAKFRNLQIDIRDRQEIINVYKREGPFDLVVHAAGQPSHDWARREPFTDFDINATGTLNLLDGFRVYSPEGVFILTSTNKVYGDAPNQVNLVELEKRYDYEESQTVPGVSIRGISEEMRIDNSTHSLFGASKMAGDIIAQEYGRYFNLNVGIFRGGCWTGPQHSAVELHGFAVYIIDCAINNKKYTIFGHKGKQVRDQIHSKDVVRAFYEFYEKPKQGIVYNLGGGKYNSASILETIDILRQDFGLKLNHMYSKQNRIGDHICYYTDMSKFKKDYHNWKVRINLHDEIKEIIEWKER